MSCRDIASMGRCRTGCAADDTITILALGAKGLAGKYIAHIPIEDMAHDRDVNRNGLTFVFSPLSFPFVEVAAKGILAPDAVLVATVVVIAYPQLSGFQRLRPATCGEETSDAPEDDRHEAISLAAHQEDQRLHRADLDARHRGPGFEELTRYRLMCPRAGVSHSCGEAFAFTEQ